MKQENGIHQDTDGFPLRLFQIHRSGPLSRPHILVFTICIGSPIFRGISKQTENCVFLARKFFLRNTFCSVSGEGKKKRSSAVALSPRSRCVFEATVVIVIYYREVCKHSLEKKKKWEQGRPYTDTRVGDGTHIRMLASQFFRDFAFIFYTTIC